jgi:hypothetical protein
VPTRRPASGPRPGRQRSPYSASAPCKFRLPVVCWGLAAAAVQCGRPRPVRCAHALGKCAIRKVCDGAGAATSCHCEQVGHGVWAFAASPMACRQGRPRSPARMGCRTGNQAAPGHNAAHGAAWSRVGPARFRGHRQELTGMTSGSGKGSGSCHPLPRDTTRRGESSGNSCCDGSTGNGQQARTNQRRTNRELRELP